MFFTSKRSGGPGGFSDICLATRASLEDDWGEPEPLGPNINTSGFDGHPSISSDGLELYFCCWDDNVDRSGGYGTSDIWVTSRLSLSDPWAEPVNLGATVNSSAFEGEQDISADGLCLFFSGDRSGGSGGWDLWVTARKTKEEPWGNPVNLGPEINSSGTDGMADISDDGSILFFVSDRSGGDNVFDIWQVPIIPIIDFNGDGIVDSADVCIMVDHWGTDNKLCDIGPMPWGDDIVDVQDLIVLAEHLFEDYRLIAHWALDEKEGSIACDSAGEHDCTLNGNPFWQSTGGKANGAIQLDGIDDYMSSPFVLDPAKGSLSAFAWIKGGAPGQVIISQTGEFGGTWLGTNPSEGKLMTGFSDMYFGALESESVITDGQWHHVGFVYDMSTFHRRLYVDGIQVAEDATAVSGMPSDGGLYIGTSKDLEAASFFSGMIDDVRIYNVALTAEEIEALAH
ncbi:MAG TPA: hypothetical protein DIU00_21385 [Phycisphaerales bacterium]|nr:hypothetical protein [Phycisphaerales bacterium]